MTGSLATVAVSSLLSGGLFAAVASFVTGRSLARKTAAETKGINARLPAEVDSVVVAGAETAVLTMQRALESAVGRIADLELERDHDRELIEKQRGDIERLRGEVRELRTKAAHAERAAAAARKAGEELGARLEAMVRDQHGRGQ